LGGWAWGASRRSGVTDPLPRAVVGAQRRLLDGGVGSG